ncbi:S1/P1 nuclease [Aureisphaera sp. CAU 1614]|uniref:S1/P1 nuclease n=1 Tax=Halomarinibacterium sedimenti TaxID=2857106 RepID=A0A9X1K044_9FLAO|nr:S1/P1 nuclease [Halomarinibacterium sedimenti]MBW2939107.1 S1/P1 nuclease [Halomarinibacterium sedimenti]
MKKLIFLAFAFLFVTSSYAAEDWGPTGHRAVGEIAQSYLSPEVKLIIEDILDGQSLALVSTFADEIKSDERYKAFSPWHYVNFPFDSTYEKSPKSEKGDIIVAIKKCVEVLKSKEASKDDKAFYLKMLVHFMGDLHQPLHVGLAEDRGGNTFQVQWFDEGVNLHWVWDEKIIEKFGMTYTELAQNTNKLSQEELDAIQKGNVEDWMYESRTLCLDVYDYTKVGDKLSYEYMYRYAHVVRNQLQKGGIRLGNLLNTIFS